jgi:hypothetical protein
VFASLQNKFSNYRTCSLCINIEENIIKEAFALLHFNILAIIALHYSISRGTIAIRFPFDTVAIITAAHFKSYHCHLQVKKSGKVQKIFLKEYK